MAQCELNNRQIDCVCYVGKVPDTSSPIAETTDLVVLLDTSGSVVKPDMDAQKKFLTLLSARLEFGDKLVRFGLVRFASDASKEIHLTEHVDNDKTKLAKKINSLIEEGKGGTNMHVGLDTVMAEFRDHGRDAKPFKRMVLIVTDGRTTDVEAAQKAADILRKNNSRVVAVVAMETLTDEYKTKLLKIVGGPKNLVHVGPASGLDKSVQKVIDMIHHKGAHRKFKTLTPF
jgi:uncharacterized protein YegL